MFSEIHKNIIFNALAFMRFFLIVEAFFIAFGIIEGNWFVCLLFSMAYHFILVKNNFCIINKNK